MRASLALSLLLLPPLLLAPSAFAVPPDTHPCAPVPGIGCFYAPDPANSTPPLLIYLRGHHPTLRADVPAGQAVASARQAFDHYALGEAARASGHAVLVTYKSGLAVSEAQVKALESARSLAFPRRVVAAHSGGYVGLNATLDGDLAFERVILLDCFYSGSNALALKLQSRYANRCSGFFTPHEYEIKDREGRVIGRYNNERNFERNFLPHAPGCAVERLTRAPSDREDPHTTKVRQCLAGYIGGRACS